MMLFYLIVVRPYADGLLMFLEVVCHGLELALFAFASAMIFVKKLAAERARQLQWGMIGECESGGAGGTESNSEDGCSPSTPRLL